MVADVMDAMHGEKAVDPARVVAAENVVSGPKVNVLNVESAAISATPQPLVLSRLLLVARLPTNPNAVSVASVKVDAVVVVAKEALSATQVHR